MTASPRKAAKSCLSLALSAVLLVGCNTAQTQPAYHAPSTLSLHSVADRDVAYGKWVSSTRSILWTESDSPWHHSKIAIKAYTHDRPAPFALVMHGTMPQTLIDMGHKEVGGMEYLEATLYAQGFNVYELHRRGYAESEGPSCEALAARSQSYNETLVKEASYDASAALKLIRQQSNVIDVGVVAGHSFGGLEAVHLADSSPDILASINLAGALSLPSRDPTAAATPPAPEFLKRMAVTTKPTLFIYSETDWLAPIPAIKAWFSLQTAPAGNRFLAMPTLKGMDGHDGILTGDAADRWVGPLQEFVIKAAQLTSIATAE